MLVDNERIMERSAHPRWRGFSGDCDGSAQGDNPFCGDSLEVRVSLHAAEGPAAVRSAAFDGYACSLCVAVADALMERLRGMGADDVLALGADDVLGWWDGLEVGRTRRGCVELPLAVAKRAVSAALESRGRGAR